MIGKYVRRRRVTANESAPCVSLPIIYGAIDSPCGAIAELTWNMTETPENAMKKDSHGRHRAGSETAFAAAAVPPVISRSACIYGVYGVFGKAAVRTEKIRTKAQTFSIVKIELSTTLPIASAVFFMFGAEGGRVGTVRVSRLFQNLNRRPVMIAEIMCAA